MCPPVLPKPGSKDDEELVGLISMISKSTRENLDQGRYEEGFRLWGGCNGKEIKKVGVAGLGLMGHGITQVAAQAGYQVVAMYSSDLRRARETAAPIAERDLAPPGRASDICGGQSTPVTHRGQAGTGDRCHVR